jgi:hypothetical protein
VSKQATWGICGAGDRLDGRQVVGLVQGSKRHEPRQSPDDIVIDANRGRVFLAAMDNAVPYSQNRRTVN